MFLYFTEKKMTKDVAYVKYKFMEIFNKERFRYL